MFFLPIKSQPFDVLLDRVNIFCILCNWIGIVKAKIGFTLVFVSQSKIQAYAFRVSQMQVAIRLRWKTRMHGFRLSRCQISLNDFL